MFTVAQSIWLPNPFKSHENKFSVVQPISRELRKELYGRVIGSGMRMRRGSNKAKRKRESSEEKGKENRPGRS
jgi:hypothetical protein